MKKITFTNLVILLLAHLAFGQTLLQENDVKTQRFGKDVLYKDDDNNMLDGHYRIADSRGNYVDTHFKQGKKHGENIDYDYAGRMLKKMNFKEGKADGKYTTYHQDGSVSKQGQFLNGEEDGKWEYFDDDGELRTIECYKDGKKDGKWWKKVSRGNTFYIATSFYKMDIPTGVWTEKYENGDLKREITYQSKGTYIEKEYNNNQLREQKSYKEFKLDGIQLLYSKSNVLLRRELYKNGLLEKKETFFDTGRPYQIARFKNGTKHGKFVFYKSSGAKDLEGEYSNGDRTGVWKSYSEADGWLHYETTYENDTENGWERVYYKTGQVEMEGNYVKGSRDGVWKHYDEAGKLVKEVSYELGNEIYSKSYK